MLLEIYPQKKQLISITPLIDVVFILLLFFMLSSTFSKMKQIELKTASSNTSHSVKTDHKTIKMLLTAEDEILIGGIAYPITSFELQQLFSELVVENSHIHLAAESSVSIQKMISFIDHARQAGLQNIKISESVSP